MVAAEVILALIKLSMMLPFVWVLPSILLTEYWIIASFAFVVRPALPPPPNAMRETRTPERKGRDRRRGLSERGHFLQVRGKDRTDGSSILVILDLNELSKKSGMNL